MAPQRASVVLHVGRSSQPSVKGVPALTRAAICTFCCNAMSCHAAAEQQRHTSAAALRLSPPSPARRAAQHTPATPPPPPPAAAARPAARGSTGPATRTGGQAGAQASGQGARSEEARAAGGRAHRHGLLLRRLAELSEEVSILKPGRGGRGGAAVAGERGMVGGEREKRHHRQGRGAPGHSPAVLLHILVSGPVVDGVLWQARQVQGRRGRRSQRLAGEQVDGSSGAPAGSQDGEGGGGNGRAAGRSRALTTRAHRHAQWHMGQGCADV